MAKSKVLLLGATGLTGASVLDGLLEYGKDDVIALVRASSVDKPAVAKLKERGIEIRVGDTTDPIDKLAGLLSGIDTLISTIGAAGQLDQLSLVEAAKKAGVKRFIPCGFITVAPVGGIMSLRDQKEVIYNHTRVLGIPYTFIDCGYWYQISFPSLPSGRVDPKTFFPGNYNIYGNGNVKTGLTDLRDVGRYVARIIHDERTLNKFVYFFGAVTTQEEDFKLLEELSGETIPRNYVSEEELIAIKAMAEEKIKTEGPTPMQILPLIQSEYNRSKHIRGDNTPEYAKYLGYIDAGELYPDFKPITWREFLVDLLAGKTERPPFDLAGLSSLNLTSWK